MVWTLLRRLFGAREEAPLDPAVWDRAAGALPLVGALDDEERARLGTLARDFEREATWEGCGGLELTADMRASIALQACLLVLELDPRLYRRVESILVYPAAYRGDGDGPARAGEAWLRGPVVLAWDQAEAGGRRADDGRNVVLHEFAHKLDLLDDQADGAPPLAAEGHAAWRRIVEREYDELVSRAEAGRATLLDTYGATNPAEFFAVATECFFEQPRALRARHADLYELLRSFYRQDPAERSTERSQLARRRGRL
ncbi:MAG: M90 family metallopeptidase [Planctomycetota bacterium]